MLLQQGLIKMLERVFTYSSGVGGHRGLSGGARARGAAALGCAAAVEKQVTLCRQKTIPSRTMNNTLNRGYSSFAHIVSLCRDYPLYPF